MTKFEALSKAPYDHKDIWLNSVGKGWHPIVEPLLKHLQELGGSIAQVKEKFGGLRFYYYLPDGENDLTLWRIFDKEVDNAEKLSVCICEECGQPGTRIGKNWIKTRCPQHEKE